MNGRAPFNVSLLCKTLCLAAAVGVSSSACEKQISPDELTHPETAAIVRDIGERYRREYLYPAVGAQAHARLLDALGLGKYAGLRHQALASRLTTDLQQITRDFHSFVIYDPERAMRAGGRVLPKNVHSDGVSEVKRLEGNVGYLRIALFSLPQSFAKAVDAGMASLSGTDALIIDVRDTPGGHSGSVAYLCSYFFEPGERVHLNTFEYRNRTQVKEWTSPVRAPYLGRPVFVLTSEETASGAEAFAYQMQAARRALIVGETTKGAAHTGELVALEHGYAVFVPTGRAVNAVTTENWERRGVVPDISAEANVAIESAVQHLVSSLNRALSRTR